MSTLLSEAQTREVVQMKRSFPFRVVCGALHPETGEFQVYATYDRRKAMKLARQGWTVVMAQ